MKKIQFNFYKICIFLGIAGGSFGISRLVVAAFPAVDKFTIFSAFFFPIFGWWAKLEADLSKKSEDYKTLEAQMEAQDRIHEVALTDLQGRFEFLNLRIDQVMESQEMKAAVAKNSKKIKEIEEALIKQGLKDKD
jgi:hypothetical protein